jgi:hypothetical protein
MVEKPDNRNETAAAIGIACLRQVRVDVLRFDGHAGQHGAGGILHLALDDPARNLRLAVHR